LEEMVPRFHFKIVSSSYTIEDPVGMDCTSVKQAREVADKIAKQIAIDVGERPGRKVVVVDDVGSRIYEAMVKN
jgi:orotate phosphoribosyltransferase